MFSYIFNLTNDLMLMHVFVYEELELLILLE